jgi:hypothetical protein
MPATTEPPARNNAPAASARAAANLPAPVEARSTTADGSRRACGGSRYRKDAAPTEIWSGLPSIGPSFDFRMLSRTRLPPSGFIEPCLPSSAERPPSGPGWIHEIKHDGYRLMARRDPIGIRLPTRNGYDWASRYPLIVEAVDRLKVRSCLIDGEAVACDENGLAVFELLREKPAGRHVSLYAFDLLELNGKKLQARTLRSAQGDAGQPLAFMSPRRPLERTSHA